MLEGSLPWKTVVLSIIAVTALAMVVPFHSYNCPHGSVWMYGPIGIAKSTNGGPCRNGICDTKRRVADEWYVVWSKYPNPWTVTAWPF